ncbi:MAG: hypothetical protein ABW081_07040, partial [Solirubrobacteraceae bacterium]
HAPEEPITAVYTQQDAPDLADEINRLATGILTHDYPVAATPHRELCGECPGRAALCSWPEGMTLRSRAYASAGSLTGSVGPS